LSLDEARAELVAAAEALFPGGARSDKSTTRLEIAAVQFARAMRELASGVPAAKHQQKRDEKSGLRLCPGCAEAILPSHDRAGVVWLNQKNFQIHRCNRGG
jgi:hypothetical protein